MFKKKNRAIPERNSIRIVNVLSGSPASEKLDIIKFAERGIPMHRSPSVLICV